MSSDSARRKLRLRAYLERFGDDAPGRLNAAERRATSPRRAPTGPARRPGSRSQR